MKGIIGGRPITREALDVVPCRAIETRSFKPLRHADFVHEIEAGFERAGLSTANGQFALDGDADERMFATWDIASVQSGLTFMVGARNSNDKRFPAMLLAGLRVWVCTNLDVSGAIKVMRKHTTFILRDLPSMIDDGLMRVPDVMQERIDRVNRLKEIPVTDPMMHDLAVRAVDADACTKAQAWRAIEAWRRPRYNEFAARNAWSAFNAFTDGSVVGEGWARNANGTMNRSMKLNRLFAEIANRN